MTSFPLERVTFHRTQLRSDNPHDHFSKFLSRGRRQVSATGPSSCTSRGRRDSTGGQRARFLWNSPGTQRSERRGRSRERGGGAERPAGGRPGGPAGPRGPGRASVPGSGRRTARPPKERRGGDTHRGVIQDDVAAGHVAMEAELLQVLDERALGGGGGRQRAARSGRRPGGGADPVPVSRGGSACAPPPRAELCSTCPRAPAAGPERRRGRAGPPTGARRPAGCRRAPGHQQRGVEVIERPVRMNSEGRPGPPHRRSPPEQPLGASAPCGGEARAAAGQDRPPHSEPLPRVQPCRPRAGARGHRGRAGARDPAFGSRQRPAGPPSRARPTVFTLTFEAQHIHVASHSEAHARAAPLGLHPDPRGSRGAASGVYFRFAPRAPARTESRWPVTGTRRPALRLCHGTHLCQGAELPRAAHSCPDPAGP